MTYEEFINYHSDNIVIDLTDKVVVSIESIWNDSKFPANILAILIPEEEKYKYKATLIYSGHIAFIKIEYEDGKVKYFYKDDECMPQTYKELEQYESDIFYQCEENGFKKEDILEQIELIIRSKYDFRYKLSKDSLIMLEGL